MLKKLLNETKRISNKIEKAILNGEFEKISRDEQTVKISCLGEVVQIWIANDVENTGIYDMETSDYSKLIFPNIKFNNQKKVRRMLDIMNEKERKNIQQQIENLKKLLEDSNEE